MVGRTATCLLAWLACLACALAVLACLLGPGQPRWLALLCQQAAPVVFFSALNLPAAVGPLGSRAHAPSVGLRRAGLEVQARDDAAAGPGFDGPRHVAVAAVTRDVGAFPAGHAGLELEPDSSVDPSYGGGGGRWGNITFENAQPSYGLGVSKDVQDAAEFLSYHYYDVDMGSPLRAVQRYQLFKQSLTYLRYRVQPQAPPSALIMAKEGGAIVGTVLVLSQTLNNYSQRFVSYRFDDSWKGSRERLVPVLCNLAVRKDMRGRGLGRRLLEAAEAWAEAQTYPKIFLVVETDNAPARKLYASSGYEELFERPDAVVMPGQVFLEMGVVPQLYMSKRLSGGAQASDGEPAALARRASNPSNRGRNTPEPQLPRGWQQTLDPSSGRFFYWKESDPDGSATWERPQ